MPPGSHAAGSCSSQCESNPHHQVQLCQQSDGSMDLWFYGPQEPDSSGPAFLTRKSTAGAGRYRAADAYQLADNLWEDGGLVRTRTESSPRIDCPEEIYERLLANARNSCVWLVVGRRSLRDCLWFMTWFWIRWCGAVPLRAFAASLVSSCCRSVSTMYHNKESPRRANQSPGAPDSPGAPPPAPRLDCTGEFLRDCLWLQTPAER